MKKVLLIIGMGIYLYGGCPYSDCTPTAKTAAKVVESGIDMNKVAIDSSYALFQKQIEIENNIKVEELNRLDEYIAYLKQNNTTLQEIDFLMNQKLYILKNK